MAILSSTGAHHPVFNIFKLGVLQSITPDHTHASAMVQQGSISWQNLIYLNVQLFFSLSLFMWS